MLKKIFILLCVFSFCLANTKAMALSLSASSAVLIDADSASVVYEKEPYKKMPMASTTKIMTAICAIENTNTNMPLTVPDEAVGIEGSSVYLEKGEVITIKELLYAMMLNSGNDAATALAIAVSGSVEEFCNLMNRTAKNIGAKNTNFTNPSGLYDENHYTTAYDLALITSYALKNPLFAEIVATKVKKVSKGTDDSRYLKNHNRLLWQYEGCTGVKTGFTKKCGRCLVSSAKIDGLGFIAVTLNAPDDWRDHTAMLDYGFKNTVKKTVAAEGEYALTTSVCGVDVPLYFENSLEVSSASLNDLKFEYLIKEANTLPINSGMALGTAKLTCGGVTVASSPLVSHDRITTAAKKSFCPVLFDIIKEFVG